MGGDGNFRVSTLILAKTKTIADDLFVSSNGGLDAAALVVARDLLPADFRRGSNQGNTQNEKYPYYLELYRFTVLPGDGTF
jgi:hypothetical protein